MYNIENEITKKLNSLPDVLNMHNEEHIKIIKSGLMPLRSKLGCGLMLCKLLLRKAGTIEEGEKLYNKIRLNIFDYHD